MNPASKRSGRSRFRPRARAFVLFEAVIAMTAFAIVAVGLVSLLRQITRVSAVAQRDTILRQKLDTQIAWERFHGFEEKNETTRPDEDGVVFDILIEPLELENFDGIKLDHLFNVAIKATWTEANPPQELLLQQYVYQP